MGKKKPVDAVVLDRPIILEMEIVERPLSTKHQWPIAKEVRAIAETVESGKAVQLAFRTGEEMKRIQMALRHQVAKMGLKMALMKKSCLRGT